jgi:hypothetical protein
MSIHMTKPPDSVKSIHDYFENNKSHTLKNSRNESAVADRSSKTSISTTPKDGIAPGQMLKIPLNTWGQQIS